METSMINPCCRRNYQQNNQDLSSKFHNEEKGTLNSKMNSTMRWRWTAPTAVLEHCPPPPVLSSLSNLPGRVVNIQASINIDYCRSHTTEKNSAQAEHIYQGRQDGKWRTVHGAVLALTRSSSRHPTATRDRRLRYVKNSASFVSGK